MGLWVLMLLGIIQGLTEFLPVSSSGHLVLLYNIFGIESDTILLSIIFHISTLLAVIIYYRRDIWTLIRHPFCPTNRKILLTSIITFIVYLIIKPIVDRVFGGEFLSIFFVITAFLLIISDYIASRKKPIPNTHNIENIDLTYFQAIMIGISQGIAVIPGISRSGATIATARILGCGNDSARYSFLISIPIIIGSLLLTIIEGGSIASVNIWGLIVGFVLCFIVGLLCIKLMVEFVRKSKLTHFSIYLLLLSAFLILNDLVLHLF